MSVLVVLGKEGILKYVPLMLSKEEQEMLQRVFCVLKGRKSI